MNLHDAGHAGAGCRLNWAMVLAALLGGAGLATAEVFEVKPAAQSIPTTPVADADDICIWIHPSDPSLSTIIGTDKEGQAWIVYDLAGREIQHVKHGPTNNIDLRYDFPLGGKKVTLITGKRAGPAAAGSTAREQTIVMYTMDPETRRLVDVTARPIKTKMSFAYGSCMYRSAKTGKYYVIVNSYDGQVEQWELFDHGQGKVGGKLVREFDVGSRTEGCVADDEYGVLYIGEENVGIWKYTAEPDESWNPKRRLVAILGPKGPISDDLNDDIEGLTLYHNSDGTGYLIASCQGKGTFVVFKREGGNDYVASFRIVDGNGIDAVSNTDGIDVTNFNLGPAFPQGLFVVHDGNNENGDETNFKYVRWEAIARAIRPPLKIDTTWDARRAPVNRRSAP